MKNFYDVLKEYIADHQPNFGDGESVLSMLYEAYSECNRLDDAQINSGFGKKQKTSIIPLRKLTIFCTIEAFLC